ncbi:MAG: tyrosine decarboxylase MfnA [Candidatus Hodarchaeales archaeon]
MKSSYTNHQNTINLSSELSKDLGYSNGKILSSMNSQPDERAKKAFYTHLEKNLGDPALFPGTKNIEIHIIKILGRMFDLPVTGTGRILTGGSEANITALWAIRNYVRNTLKKRNRSEIIAPSSAHVSIEKAVDLLGLKLVSVSVNEAYQMDLENLRKLINSRTMAIVGVAGTTAFGTIDPLQEIDEICIDNSLPLHVDAAFGGLVFPFLPDREKYKLTFNLQSVVSLTVDIHKMGLVPIPGGCLLWRDEIYPKSIEFTLPYLAGKPKQSTLTGTRSGASAIAFTKLWHEIGYQGYKTNVENCMSNTRFLEEELRKRQFIIPIKPVINILGVKTPENSTLTEKKFHEKLWEKGWTTTVVNGSLRFVIMPPTTQNHIKKLLQVIDQLLEES